MSFCQYHEILLQDHTPVTQACDRNCFMVRERWICKHNGAHSNAEGLVTTGAGPCMVVVVHDSDADIGCMAHITENLTDHKTFILGLEVIERMIFSLRGLSLIHISEPTRQEAISYDKRQSRMPSSA